MVELPEDAASAATGKSGSPLTDTDAAGSPAPTALDKDKRAVSRPDRAVAFRPTIRPRTPMLCIVDDGERDNGEWIRLRQPRTVIGREEGDVRIAQDEGVSSRHAELVRQREGGVDRWYLRDLQSTNGTFVRVQRCRLRDGREFQLGTGRFAFHEPPMDPRTAGDETEELGIAIKATRRLSSLNPASLDQVLPALLDLSNPKLQRAHPIHSLQAVVGRDPDCEIRIPHDPYLDRKHARIFRDSRARWIIENLDSVNGVWVRVDEIRLDSPMSFQLGEQRFLFRVP